MKQSIHSGLTEKQTGGSFKLTDHTHMAAKLSKETNQISTWRPVWVNYKEQILKNFCKAAMCDLLAVVEDDSAVWPAVMIHQTQVWKKTHSHRLKTPLVAHSEAVAVNLGEELLHLTQG